VASSASLPYGERAQVLIFAPHRHPAAVLFCASENNFYFLFSVLVFTLIQFGNASFSSNSSFPI